MTPQKLAEVLRFIPDGDGHCLEAADELRRLSAENAELKQKLSACMSRCNAAVGQADALRKDAERLRFCADVTGLAPAQENTK